uniref:Pentacotripeptide-repeat region of PRORP domain-containing protein n=1 Tax=Oryza brachyantha TaxID=4533 RepID=J3LNJ1_ORYBR
MRAMASPCHSPFPLSPPSSCHGGGVLQLAATRAAASPFACYCRAPASPGGDHDDHDAGILQALASNGNGSVVSTQKVLDPGSEGDESGDGGGRRPSSRLRARDCAKRIMGLPVEERVKVLDLLQCKDGELTVSDYNDIISALARAGDHDSAVALFRALRPNGVVPDAQSYDTAVQCLCRKGAPDEAKEALDEMVARGFGPTIATFSAGVGCLCKRGRISRAMEVFDTMRAVGCEPTIRTYNNLIGGLCYVGRLEEALDLLNKLKESPKQTPDIYTFTIVLDGFCKVGRTDEATAIFQDAVRNGLSPTIFTYNALLNGHCKEGNPLKAYSLLMEMCGNGACPPDKISFSIVLQALLRAGETSAAWQTYKRMERAGFEADGRALDTLARGLCRRCAADISALADARERGRSRDALRVLALVIARDFVPGRNAFDALLGELARQGRWPDAMAVYAAAVKRGVLVSLKRHSKEALLAQETRESSGQLSVPQ